MNSNDNTLRTSHPRLSFGRKDRASVSKRNNDHNNNPTSLVGEQAPNVRPESLIVGFRDGRDDAIRLCDYAEPGPRTELVRGLIFDSCLQIMYGHSGLGKSYFALHTAQCICRGIPLLGHDTERKSVLWIDMELDAEEQVRRARQIARGMGYCTLPNNLHYLRPIYPIGYEESQELIMKTIEQHDIGLCILDSLSVGSSGSDMTSQRDVVSMLKSIEDWGCVLAIDHITKSDARSDQSRAEIFGSTFKRAIARSTMKLVRDGNGVHSLIHDKVNFGEQQPSTNFRVDFHENKTGTLDVRYTRSSESICTANCDKLSTYDETLNSIRQLHASLGRGPTLEEIATLRGFAPKTIKNHLPRLGSEIVRHDDGRISAAEAVKLKN